MSSLNAPLVPNAHARDTDYHPHDPHHQPNTAHHDLSHTPALDIHQQAQAARIRADFRHPAAKQYDAEQQQQLARNPNVPPRYASCFLTTVTVMRVTAAIALLTIAGVTVEAIHQTVVNRPIDAAPDFFTAVLALIFHFFTALVLVAALLHWQPLLRRLALLGSYLFCGLSLCYLSVLVLANATVEGRFDVWLVDVLRVVCGGLFLIGVVLAVLGCIGGQGMEDRRRARMEQDRLEHEGLV